MVMLAGGTRFAISFALFRFVLPVGTWVVSAPELMVSCRPHRHAGHGDHDGLAAPLIRGLH